MEKEINDLEQKTNKSLSNIQYHLDMMDCIGNISLEQLKNNTKAMDHILEEVSIVENKLEESKQLQNKFNFFHRFLFSWNCFRKNKTITNKHNLTTNKHKITTIRNKKLNINQKNDSLQQISNSLDKIKQISDDIHVELVIQNEKLSELEINTYKVNKTQLQVNHNLKQCLF
jgi:hypothetical protein